MAKNTKVKQNYTAIADAIRAKTNSTELMKASEMPQKISEIETGIIPEGTLNISTNGEYDVTTKATATVQVQPKFNTTYISYNGIFDVKDYKEANVNVSPYVTISGISSMSLCKDLSDENFLGIRFDNCNDGLTLRIGHNAGKFFIPGYCTDKGVSPSIIEFDLLPDYADFYTDEAIASALTCHETIYGDEWEGVGRLIASYDGDTLHKAVEDSSVEWADPGETPSRPYYTPRIIYVNVTKARWLAILDLLPDPTTWCDMFGEGFWYKERWNEGEDFQFWGKTYDSLYDTGYSGKDKYGYSMRDPGFHCTDGVIKFADLALPEQS